MATEIASGNGWKHLQLTSIAASLNNYTEVVDCRGYDCVGVQVVYADHADTSTWYIAVSNDDSHYDLLSGSNHTTSGATGSASSHTDGYCYAYLKVKCTEADAAGTYAIYVMLRRKARN